MKYLAIPSLTIVMTVLILASCKDEALVDSQRQSDRLRFEVTVDNGWQSAGSRAASAYDMSEPEYVEVIPLEGTPPGDSLYLHVTVEDGIDMDERHDAGSVMSRGVILEGDSFYDSFGLLGGVDREDPATYLPDYIFGEKITEESLWTSSYLLPPHDATFRFYAYAPYVAPLQGDVPSGTVGLILPDSIKRTPGPPEVTYVQPSKAADRTDLLFAASDPVATSAETPVPLNFYHALTAVKVVFDNVDRGVLKALRFSGVYSKAKQVIGSGIWTDYSDKRTDTVSFPEGTRLAKETAVDTRVFFPQDTVQIELEYIPDGLSKAFKLSTAINSTKWQMGKTVTYTISTSKSIKRAFKTGNAVIPAMSGGGGEFSNSVSSYIEFGSDYGVKYNISYTDENGVSCEKPDWINIERQSSHTLKVKVSPMAYTVDNVNCDFSESKGTADAPYNLSNRNDGGNEILNTANCYIINSPGYYTLPLVYGNAIKNGTDNPSAYRVTTENTDYLTNFVDYNDEPITGPYIIGDDATGNYDAVLVWQDTENLVTDVKLRDNKWIDFAIGSPAKSGNAVVAVRDPEGTIMWSWHIWVTSYDPYSEGGCVKICDLDFMTTYLGWCGRRYTFTGSERSCRIKITQNGTGDVKTFTIKQYPSTELHGWSPVYQWGRKDPLFVGNGSSPFNNSFFDTYIRLNYEKVKQCGGEYNYSLKTDPTLTIGSSIKEPNMAHRLASNSPYWYLCDNSKALYINLWNSRRTVPTTKTVYDPCPVGFSIPQLSTFTLELYNEELPKQHSPHSISLYTDETKTQILDLPTFYYLSYPSVGIMSADAYKDGGLCRSIFIKMAQNYDYNYPNGYDNSNYSRWLFDNIYNDSDSQNPYPVLPCKEK